MRMHKGRCLECGTETTTAYADDYPLTEWKCKKCGRIWRTLPHEGISPESTVQKKESGGAYSSLQKVLEAARIQAESGKGHERHASDEAFEDQPIQWIEKHFKSFQLGQAVKKMHESQRLDKDAAIKELLGAINYLAARVIYLEGGAR